MISSIILINVARSSVNSVADALVKINGVSEVYSVAGQYDLVAIVRVNKNEELADIVTDHILAIEGITQTETLIAFRVFSKHDLESMFSIGIE